MKLGVSSSSKSSTTTVSHSDFPFISSDVAGAAALLLEKGTSSNAVLVADELLAFGIPNRVSNPGTGSPNLLLHTEEITDGSSSNPPPPPATTTAELKIYIDYDNYPQETSLYLYKYDYSASAWSNIAVYGAPTTRINDDTFFKELDDGYYALGIWDSWGDGICCSYGQGSYTLSLDNNQFATGTTYGSWFVQYFQIQGQSITYVS